MDGIYSAGKSKRKDFHEVSDDFSDFNVSFPARKIRRLDAELPPIIEEEESMVPTGLERVKRKSSGGSNTRKGVVIEELPVVQEKEERSLIVYKPTMTSLVRSPSNFTVSVVDPLLVSGFKTQVLWPSQRNLWTTVNDSKEQDKDSGITNECLAVANECLAVVPWVPCLLPFVAESEVAPQLDSSDMMEAEDAEGETMDIEEGSDIEQRSGMNLNEGLPPWVQHHCLVPQPPQNTPTPVVSFR